MQPTVSVDVDGTHFTLWREEKKNFSFGEHTVQICGCKPDELDYFEKKKMEDAPVEEGMVYYIYAAYDDVGPATFVWLTKEEAFFLKKELQKAERHYFEEHEYD
jgi:hypothetical protein